MENGPTEVGNKNITFWDGFHGFCHDIGSRYLGNPRKAKEILENPKEFEEIIKSLENPKNIRLRRLWTKISPSSEGVGGKTGYLGLRSGSQLSRKQVFRMIGNVFRAENSITKKSSQLGKCMLSTLFAAS